MKHRFLLFFFALASVWPLSAQKTYRFPMTLTYDMYLNFGERKQYDARLFFSGEAACFTYRPIKDYSHVDEMNPEVDTWKINAGAGGAQRSRGSYVVRRQWLRRAGR